MLIPELESAPPAEDAGETDPAVAEARLAEPSSAEPSPADETAPGEPADPEAGQAEAIEDAAVPGEQPQPHPEGPVRQLLLVSSSDTYVRMLRFHFAKA